MAIGGFNGSDPSPTLAEFQHLVADGEIHWLVAGGGRLGGGSGLVPFGPGPTGGGEGGTAAEITAWVRESFTATTVDGVTLYDLSAPAAS